MIVQYRNEKVSHHGSIPITIDCNVVAFIVFEEGIPPAHKAPNKLYCRTHKSRYQVPIAELAERWTELPQVSDESRSFFRVHTGYFSNIPKCIKAEFIASWACSQSSVVSSSKR
ncbi:hypothetical protein TNCV_96151 [Trichonephila clavipes]|nr:hypothetical protein TNCV_96151 [Trichonephila clavipes]